LNDSEYQILTFDAREDTNGTGDIQLLLPPEGDIDAVLGTEKWLVRQAQSEALGLNAATQITIAPGGQSNPPESGATCGHRNDKLEW
jgi:nitrite reductase (NAD(P)H)